MRLIPILVLALSAALAVADTEILNFRLPPPDSNAHAPARARPDVRLTQAQAGAVGLSVSASDPERWVELALPAGAWTARVSWAASSPTRFGLSQHADRLRITAAPLSPRMPHPLLGTADSDGGPDDSAFSTDFTLVVEPLVAGVPRSALPAAAAVLVFAAGACLAVRRIIPLLEAVAGREGAMQVRLKAE
ncbi:hypothetical protein Q5752_000929 [Cryptotrichosporon argae]